MVLSNQGINLNSAEELLHQHKMCLSMQELTYMHYSGYYVIIMLYKAN